MWRAVLIGINSYEDSNNFPPLKYARSDVEQLRSLITDPKIGEFRAEYVKPLYDVAAGDVIDGIEDVLGEATREDSVLIYFAGHGKTDAGGRLCLAARNSRAKRLASSVHMDIVKRLIENSRARRIVLVVDSCFSGAAGESFRGSEIPTTSFEEMSGTGKVIIASSGQFEAAREDDKLRHGVFAHFFLEGLRTGDADRDNDGRIGVDEIFEYTRERMKAEKFPQVPWKLGDSTGDIYIAKSIRALRQKEETERELQARKERIYQWYRDKQIPANVYNESLRIVLAEDGQGQELSEKEQTYRKILHDAFRGELGVTAFVELWQRTGQMGSPQEAWQGDLTRPPEGSAKPYRPGGGAGTRKTGKKAAQPVREVSQADAAAQFILSNTEIRPVIGVMGGAESAAFGLTDPQVLSYEEIPFMAWLGGSRLGKGVTLGKLGDVAIAVLRGVPHVYGGYSSEQIALPTRMLALAGVRALMVTVAAGSLNPELPPGSLVLVSDHVNLLGTNPLIGRNDERFGPRFVDLSEVYSKEYRSIALQTARELNIPIREGVYAAAPGPTYETPAEVRYYRQTGADIVGMSLVPEAIVARHMGIGVLAIAVTTNFAPGILANPISHENVLSLGTQLKENLGTLLTAVIPKIAATLQ